MTVADPGGCGGGHFFHFQSEGYVIYMLHSKLQTENSDGIYSHSLSKQQNSQSPIDKGVLLFLSGRETLDTVCYM